MVYYDIKNVTLFKYKAIYYYNKTPAQAFQWPKNGGMQGSQ